MNKTFLLLLLFLNTAIAQDELKVDTLYVLFDSSHPRMRTTEAQLLEDDGTPSDVNMMVYELFTDDHELIVKFVYRPHPKSTLEANAWLREKRQSYSKVLNRNQVVSNRIIDTEELLEMNLQDALRKFRDNGALDSKFYYVTDICCKTDEQLVFFEGAVIFE